MKENQPGFFKGFAVFMAKLLLAVWLCGTTYFTYCYFTELPKLKMKAAAGSFTAKTQTFLQKKPWKVGWVYTIDKIGSNHIQLKRFKIPSKILMEELAKPIPEGCTQLMYQKDGTYLPLVK